MTWQPQERPAIDFLLIEAFLEVRSILTGPGRRGALFSVGDGHAAQGDGEVCVTAMETSLRGAFQLIVRKDMKLDWPRAETPTDYMTMGFHENLTDAMR